ncbi:hypothetical protein [Rheinheimera salexigens]|uniref:Uncharacterized protein n=1 Tax=Rheinheimera salexigens TaxID=1628148 RepID=A0A1E7Q8K5_9GAMM|nr:hypothetical protein [Rheinheimera salexigens]OEY70477.1 hypothetical protein BI198_13550 [Rheinheimera salexigens]
MTDVVLLQLMSSLFWLLVFGVIVFIFRREIRALFGSVASFKIAGSSFEFQDKKDTLQSYILLTEILIDMLFRESWEVPLAPLEV